ncbi:hypothetical protein P879_01804 [Paragonimus westermani]|uniref:V-SNARE coiled-coil homology domain-containing protein n=1 Tax=Paragonimus westermani TaxID=34504 RepID=A0A8T0DUS8_9TREM|nr:hypothetical protein P879_01804 [Paragonimus westermani]
MTGAVVDETMEIVIMNDNPNTSCPPERGCTFGMNEKTPIIPNKRLQQTQAQVNEVVDIMRVNVDKVLERDQKLSELDGRADALQAGASQFEASAGKLKRKFWWKNCKMLLLLSTLITILAVVVIVWVVSEQKSKSAESGLIPPNYSRNQSIEGGVTYSESQPGGMRGRETVPKWMETNGSSGESASKIGAISEGTSASEVNVPSSSLPMIKATTPLPIEDEFGGRLESPYELTKPISQNHSDLISNVNL